MESVKVACSYKYDTHVQCYETELSQSENRTLSQLVSDIGQHKALCNRNTNICFAFNLHTFTESQIKIKQRGKNPVANQF